MRFYRRHRGGTHKGGGRPRVLSVQEAKRRKVVAKARWVRAHPERVREYNRVYWAANAEWISERRKEKRRAK